MDDREKLLAEADRLEAAYRRYLAAQGIVPAVVSVVGLLAWLDAGGDVGPDAVVGG